MSRRLLRVSLLATGLLLVFQTVAAAQPAVIPEQAGEPVQLASAGEESIDVIIVLKGDAVATFKAHLHERRPQQSPTPGDPVRSYAALLSRQQADWVSAVREQGIRLDVRYSYTYLLNAMAATIRSQDRERLAALPSVQAIDLDYPLRVTLPQSVPLIGAPGVWAMIDGEGRPVTGQGIRVAVLDTGIDYTHPDLGGCLGPGCKVAGGYDLVNNDADPMDDHGHGTHCAGIVAANGALKGVAPDATLYAYKVMNETGWGNNSWGLAGLERATNPDGDPATDDGADVISMSLARAGGTPDDFLALAVDAAVRQGAVVAVAVGNEGGYGYWTIGAPGTSRQAISVGASDKSDALFSLSSRGPITDSWTLIKLDILAPGVSISSTVPTSGALGHPGRYLRLSGDSMAVPHIAGCAALVRQLHPDWSPEQVKATLMNTARDVGLDAYVQGAGRVQVDQAARARAIITPPSVGFGFVDGQVPVWSNAAPLLLTSTHTTTVRYSLAVSGTLPAGVIASFDPVSVTLTAGQSVTVTFRLTVDNALTPYLLQDPYFYQGRVVAIPDESTESPALAVPFTYSKTRYLEISGWVPYFVLVHDGVHRWDRVSPPNPLTLLLPAGTYDVIAYHNLGTHWVVREGVVVSGSTRLNLSLSEASHTITMAPRDKDGVPVTTTRCGFTQVLRHIASGFGVRTAPWNQDLLRPRLSNISSAYTWECRLDTAWEGDWYSFSHRLLGISADSTYQNDPASLRRVVYRFHPAPGTTALTAKVYSPNPSIIETVTAPFLKTAYYVPPSADSALPGFAVSTHDALTDGWIHISPELWITSSGRLEGYVPGSAELLFDTEGLELHLGQSPPHWFTSFHNGSTSMTLKPVVADASWMLYQTSDRWLTRPMTYQVYQAGVAVRTGTLLQIFGPWQDTPEESVPLPAAGAYSFTVSSDAYWVQDRAGQARVVAEFDTRRADRDPPSLLTLNVLYQGETTDVVPRDAACTLTFRVRDAGGLASVTLAYRLDGSWQPLPLTQSGDLYSALFPGASEDGFVSLSLTARDTAGNALTHEAVPAFAVAGQGPALTPTPTPTATPTPTVTPTSVPGKRVVLQQGLDGYAGSQDTTLNQWAPDTNDCGADLIKVGYHQQYASLIRFDVSSVPARARVQLARLEVYARAWDGTEIGVDAFAITRTVQLCQATWNLAAAGVSWGGPGCNDTHNDRRADPEDNFMTSGNNQWYSLDLTDVVQGWVDGNLANNGVLLRASAYPYLGPFQFASAEAGQASQRPRLVITFLYPHTRVTSDPEDSRDPALCRAEDGRLWAAWNSNLSGNEDIWLKTSGDRGLTWSAGFQLTTDPGSDEAPDILETGDGRLWVLWRSNRSGQAEAWFTISGDGGVTWSPPSSAGPVGADARPVMAQVSDGKIWIAWRGVNYRTTADGGLTWSTTGTLGAPDGHPTLFQAYNGRLWVIYSSATGGHDPCVTLWGTTSPDAGLTWSSPRELTPASWKTDDDSPTMAQSADGTLYLMWQREWFYGPCGPDVLYQTSTDNGETWSEATSWLAPIADTPNPDLAALTDGAVGVVWSSDQAGDGIWFGIPGETEDLQAPPYVCCLYQELPPSGEVNSDDVVRLCANVYGADAVSLAWTLNGTPQPDLPFGPATYQECPSACGGNFQVELGPFPAGTFISWRLKVTGHTWPVVFWPQTPFSLIVTEPTTPTPTATLTPTASRTPATTHTATVTATQTPTSTYTATVTPTRTETPTETATATGTPTVTPTPTESRYWLHLPVVLR